VGVETYFSVQLREVAAAALASAEKFSLLKIPAKKFPLVFRLGRK
jgi:hypothetical protein